MSFEVGDQVAGKVSGAVYTVIGAHKERVWLEDYHGLSFVANATNYEKYVRPIQVGDVLIYKGDLNLQTAECAYRVVSLIPGHEGHVVVEYAKTPIIRSLIVFVISLEDMKVAK